MDIQTCCVHINTVEQAFAVFDFYGQVENGRFTHDSVHERNCLDYPYLMARRSSRDIFGSKNDHDRECYEFDEWAKTVALFSKLEPVKDSDIDDLLGI